MEDASAHGVLVVAALISIEAKRENFSLIDKRVVVECSESQLLGLRIVCLNQQ